MKQKEILLFGATGQIGRNLIRKLTKNNYKIIAVTRNIHRAGYILKTQANPGYLELVELKNFNIEKELSFFDEETRKKVELHNKAVWINDKGVEFHDLSKGSSLFKNNFLDFC